MSRCVIRELSRRRALMRRSARVDVGRERGMNQVAGRAFIDPVLHVWGVLVDHVAKQK